jgi:hypothetical protein
MFIFTGYVEGRIYLLGIMAHNVPVVYDVFAARIRACVARPGLQKCGEVLAWEWSVGTCPYCKNKKFLKFFIIK